MCYEKSIVVLETCGWLLKDLSYSVYMNLPVDPCVPLCLIIINLLCQKLPFSPLYSG